MKKALLLIFLCFGGLLLFIYACPPDKAKDIVFEVPKDWPEPKYKFENNKPTLAGFELGRKLFYDPRLSKDNTISCGSCHQPFAAFSHIDHATSHGIGNKLGKRNAPPLFNLNWHPSFFWDGGVNHLEIQPLTPMVNPIEMDQTLEELIPKLQNDDTYKKMFKQAFGKSTINSQQVFKALAQFMGMLVSSNSKYDKYMRKEPGGEFTPQELNGLQIYKEKCASCHKEPLFTDFTFKNNGLKPRYGSGDSGRATITRLEADLGKFKVPSLRNLKYTPPYMHDGRFNELEDVIEHYSNPKYPSPALDPSVKFIYLTPSQKGELLAFLNTLNDEEFTKNPMFKDSESKSDKGNEHHNKR